MSQALFIHRVSTSPSILLVTPVWNDASRLRQFGPQMAQALADSDLSVRWVIADDGSAQEEVSQLKELVAQFSTRYADLELITCSQRYRKGGAIYQAWDRNADAKWFAFVDADGAINAATVIHLLREAQSSEREGAVIGVRKNSSQNPVRRPLGRAVSFTLFTSMVRSLLGIKLLDTQCGLKVVPAASYRAVADKLYERGFVFDVELLVALAANHVHIQEVPITWSEMPGGKVHPLRDAWGMLAGVLRIRKRLHGMHYLVTPLADT